MSFSGGTNNDEYTCNERGLGLTSELGRSPGGGHGKPLQYSCLENPHGQRSLTDYSPWGHKESDTTERLSTHTPIFTKEAAELEKEVTCSRPCSY